MVYFFWILLSKSTDLTWHVKNVKLRNVPWHSIGMAVLITHTHIVYHQHDEKPLQYINSISCLLIWTYINHRLGYDLWNGCDNEIISIDFGSLICRFDGLRYVCVWFRLVRVMLRRTSSHTHTLSLSLAPSLSRSLSRSPTLRSRLPVWCFSCY